MRLFNIILNYFKITQYNKNMDDFIIKIIFYVICGINNFKRNKVL